MKNILFLTTILALSLGLSGCTGSSGGTTQDTPPTPTTPVTPTPNPSGQFNVIQSTFQVLDSSNTEVSVAGVGQPLKLRLTAKDQYGNLMSGLNIKFSRVSVLSPDLVPTEISTGVYEASFSSNDQSSEEFSVTKDSLSVSLNKALFISFCAGSASPSASPFFNSTVISGDTYYIICSASHLASARNFLTRNYILGNNIDLSTFYIDANSDLIPDNQFKIGNSTTPYTGKFKGYGLVIKGFKYISNSESDVGFFGKLSSGASISKIVLDSPKVSGLNNVGSLAGSVETTSASVLIDEVGILTAQNLSTSGSNQGGLIGLVDGTLGQITIQNSSSSSSISLNSSLASRSRIGGSIGYAKNAIITQNYFDSSIIFDDKSMALTDLGGVIGKMENVNTFTNNSSNVSLTINSGTNVGGLVGSITNSFLGDLSSNTIALNFSGTSANDFNKIGGLFGDVNGSSLLSITGFITSITPIKSAFGGLAYSLTNSTATKIILNGSFIFESNFIGGMYSLISSSTLNKNWNYSALSSTTTQSHISGITARSNNSSISSSNFEGQIIAPSSSMISGIATLLISSNNISNSSFKGTIQGSSQISGLIGYSGSTSGEQNTIFNSFSSGSLTASSFVAGLALEITDYDSIQSSFITSLIKNSFGNDPTDSASIVLNRANNLSVLNNIRYLSSRTGITACTGPAGCSGGTSIADTDTNSANDLDYYYTPTNAPMNNWDFANTWLSFGSFPVLRY